MSITSFMYIFSLQKGTIYGIWLLGQAPFLSKMKYGIDLNLTSPPDPIFNLLILITILVRGHIN